MRAVRDAIVARLMGDSTVLSYVGTFRGRPSIFARRPVPTTVSGRFVIVEAPFGDRPGVGETKTSSGRLYSSDIGIYGDNTGDPAPIEELGEIIRDLFDREPLLVSGYGSAIVSRVDGPVEAETDERMYGQIVTTSFELIRES